MDLWGSVGRVPAALARELLNCSSPLAWCQLWLSVSSTSPRSGLASEVGDSICSAGY
jgi:hypothetical protein